MHAQYFNVPPAPAHLGGPDYAVLQPEEKVVSCWDVHGD